ncbi:unknown [Bacteroides sp. CAG:633]|nr:unknown [Bacteroides sp. CAG:633]
MQREDTFLKTERGCVKTKFIVSDSPPSGRRGAQRAGGACPTGGVVGFTTRCILTLYVFTYHLPLRVLLLPEGGEFQILLFWHTLVLSKHIFGQAQSRLCFYFISTFSGLRNRWAKSAIYLFQASGVLMSALSQAKPQ